MKKILMMMLAVMVSVMGFGQESKKTIIPASPQTEAMLNYHQKYFGKNIGATGTEMVSIDLYDIVTSEITIPIKLLYNTCGVKYKQEDGDVGVGWSLTPSARVSRTMIGEPDETQHRIVNVSAEISKKQEGEELDRYLRAFIRTGSSNMYSYPSIGEADKGCDIFSFSTISEHGHFIFSDPKNINTIEVLERNNFKIKPLVENKLLNGFQITDNSGFIYNYGGDWTKNLTETTIPTDYLSGVRTAWALESIITPNGETIKFRYTAYVEKSITLLDIESKTLEVTDAGRIKYANSSSEVPFSVATNLNVSIAVPKYTTFLISEIETNSQIVKFIRNKDVSNQLKLLSRIEVLEKTNTRVIKNIALEQSRLPQQPHVFLESVTIANATYGCRYYKEEDFYYQRFDPNFYISDRWGYYLYEGREYDKIQKPVLLNEFKLDKYIFTTSINLTNPLTFKSIEQLLSSKNFKKFNTKH